MKTVKPPYFDDIQQRAGNRWKQLESDPELAAPWHQLFNQVQSPRHVISELLQNADDAQATEVSVKIIDSVFTFSHNGKDFTSEEFASLCRFGYSNKRVLRTIGFRGIGFKSTFSLGDTVGLRTPTLKVAFQKKRFTLPIWFGDELSKDKNTSVLVKIADDQRKKDLVNNMQEWLSSPFSLLFFNHIRRLKLGDQDLQWSNLGPGPIPNSNWMALQGKEARYLVVRSLDEFFPDDALKEIREERLLDLSEATYLPPCKVEIVLGAPGQLFVVLPTGVQTPLPFAMNAPFVQDPARLKIKDPEISPTNRWLLQRIGQLAAISILQWLQREELSTAERAQAYDLLPAPCQKNNFLESVCAQVVGEASINTMQGNSFVLSEDGSLEKPDRCLNLPAALWEIWNSDQIISILSEKIKNPRLLSNKISQSNQQKLQEHHATISIEADDFIDLLTGQTPPRPKTWTSLLTLWELASKWSSYYRRTRELNIQPVRGKSVLYSANNIIRLGEKKLLQSEDDWDFLGSHLLVMDVNWLRYLTEQRRIASESNDKALSKMIDGADQLLQRTDLNESSNLDIIIEQVAKNFFTQNKPQLEDCVRFTQIAAKLNAKIGSAFQYWTMDGVLRPNTDTLLFDDTGRLEKFLPPQYKEHLLIHEKYSQDFNSCSKDDWLNWIHSGNAGIKTFIPISAIGRFIRGKQHIEDEVKTRGYAGKFEYRYNTFDFQLDDWDFPPEYWKYWEAQVLDDPALWSVLVGKLLYQPKAWEYAKTAIAFHLAKNRNYKTLTSGLIIPGWILKLRELPCIRDTRGNYHRPTELMRRSPQTEPLLDVEPFVDAHLDTEAARPLLDLLGVRNTPTGPKQILHRLSALAKVPKPPILELIKWYQRLDTMFDDCTTEDQQEIKSFFHNERLIFTDDGTWQTAAATFIASDENEIPNAALIHSEANRLSLWRKIGVHERPTIEITIKWLKGFSSGERIPTSDTRRVKALLGRHPVHIRQECGHWLNLAGEWAPVENLQYSLTMQSLIPWTHFHDWVKEKTADLTMLSTGLINEPPFNSWPSLASQIEKRIEKTYKPGNRISLSWLQSLGRLLMRIRFSDLAQTLRVRYLASLLAKTECQSVETISVISYLNDMPAGMPEYEKLAWVDRIIFITNIPKPRLVRQISEKITGVFDWPELNSILSYSFERSEKDIYAYLDENFTLDPEKTVIPIEYPNGQGEIATITITPSHEEQPEHSTLLDIPETDIIPETNFISGAGTEGIQNIHLAPTEGIVTTHNEPKPTQPPRQPQIRPPLIERFALVNEYHKNGSTNFTHSNGNTLSKSDGIFPWLAEGPGGKVICYYWIKEHCLQNKPLELPTEIWHLIEKDAQHHAMILEDVNGEPLEMSGIDLQKLKEDGTLKLFPATYRLTLASEDQ